MTPFQKQTTFLMLAIIAVVLWLLFKSGCNHSENPNSSTDSTSIWKLQAKQAGNAAAIYMTEVSRLQAKSMELRIQLDNVKAHESKLTATNLSLIKKLRQTAPKDCEPYIDSTITYYNEVINAKDSSYSALMGVLLVTDSASLVKDSIIVELGVQIVAKDKVITATELERDKANKKAKRAKIINKVILAAAVAWTGFVAYVTMGD